MADCVLLTKISVKLECVFSNKNKQQNYDAVIKQSVETTQLFYLPSMAYLGSQRCCYPCYLEGLKFALLWEDLKFAFANKKRMRNTSGKESKEFSSVLDYWCFSERKVESSVGAPCV